VSAMTKINVFIFCTRVQLKTGQKNMRTVAKTSVFGTKLLLVSAMTINASFYVHEFRFS
jgi:hypothetical protein